MPEIEQSVGVRNAIFTSCLNILRREGVRGVEIPYVLERAEVSESVFYEQFQSKDGFLWAFLRDRHAIWMRWFENEIEARFEASGGGLEIIADVLQMGLEDPKRFGFAFIHIVNDAGGFDNEPFVIAREQKEHLRRLVKDLAEKMGLQHPDMAASSAIPVIERTIVCSLTTGSLKEAQTARLLLKCLQHS